ncbi:MAG: signal peptidase I [Akkermansiaceae bacterium]|nr:signal peptidase I [Akkermansiaceae bacterium]
MFTPRWKKEAKHLHKGARKFIQYKRDLLEEGRVGEIESRREDLKEAIREGDRDKVDEASKQLQACCENSLPREKPIGWFEENVEVMFVAIVIALGLRTYYLQPFRIPTGSMEPTLNGINGHEMQKEKWPSLPHRLWEKAMRGRSYERVVAEEDLYLPVDIREEYQTDLRDTMWMHFFSRSELVTVDGKAIPMPAPPKAIYDAGFRDVLAKAVANGGNMSPAERERMTPMDLRARKGEEDTPEDVVVVRIPAGTTLCEGYIDTGDLVLVNKFAYHFRKPERGETFVFDTRGIRGIDDRYGPQAKGSHYIKRLCGVPGDVLEIKPPELWINGSVAMEPKIVEVMERTGYTFASKKEDQGGRKYYRPLDDPGDTLTLSANADPGMREYAALGDNTNNSLDSRYWGEVKEFNLVGPALFSLWPFTTGHWGFID